MAATFIKKPPTALAWVLMDAPEARIALEKYLWKSPVAVVKALDSMLRGIAQVAFGNNPLTGLLILIGLFLANINSGIGAIVCSLTAIITAKLLNWADDQIAAGHSNFNAVLIGTVATSLYPKFFDGDDMPPQIWGYLVLASVFTVCIMSGLGRITMTHNIPALTLPFNLAVGTMYVCMKSGGYGDLNMTLEESGNFTEGIEWDQVIKGPLLAAGHVWGVQDWSCSVLVYLGLFIFSPCLVVASSMGATLGTLCGLIVSTGPYDDVYNGVWGYNAFLASGCITFFMAPTPKVFLVAAINALLATCMHAALIPVFMTNGLPVFTFPFCLATVLSLSTAMAMGPPELRVSNPTFPELHYLKYNERTKNVKANGIKEKDEEATEPMVAV